MLCRSIIIFLCFVGSVCQAQFTIRGQVFEKDMPIPYVSVTEEGTKNEVFTDADGRFEISISKLGQTLVFKFLGFQTETKVIRSTKPLKIRLWPALVTFVEPYPDYIEIGPSSGVFHTPFGVTGSIPLFSSRFDIKKGELKLDTRFGRNNNFYRAVRYQKCGLFPFLHRTSMFTLDWRSRRTRDADLDQRLEQYHAFVDTELDETFLLRSGLAVINFKTGQDFVRPAMVFGLGYNEIPLFNVLTEVKVFRGGMMFRWELKEWLGEQIDFSIIGDHYKGYNEVAASITIGLFPTN